MPKETIRARQKVKMIQKTAYPYMPLKEVAVDNLIQQLANYELIEHGKAVDPITGNVESADICQALYCALCELRARRGTRQ